MKLKIFNIGKGVCQYYRKNVKGNQEASQELIQKKLTRNVYLSAKGYHPFNDDRELFMYGNLHIWIKDNTIYKIKNVKGKSGWFYKDEKKFDELNELLKIDVLEALQHADENIA